MRIKFIIFCLLVSFFSGILYAQSFQLISSHPSEVKFDFHLNEFAENSININGNEYHNFGIDYQVLTSEKGEPAMPFFSQAVKIPNQGNVSYSVVYDGISIIEGIDIVPSKGNLKRNVDPATIPYTFGEVYTQDEFYPGEISQISEPFILRNTRGVTVSLYPYQYNPVQKTLMIYENLRIVVNTDLAVDGINELQSAGKISAAFQNIYDHIYLNPDANPPYAPVAENGSLLVISAPEFTENIQTLIDWKIQSGIRTTVVTTAETGTTAAQIKDFVQDYYNNHNDLTFLLLVGDSDKIPAHTYGYNGEQLWSDSFYGQLAGGSNDLFPEVLVGRLSGNASEIDVMVSRILEYEKNPDAGDWMKNAAGLGSSEGAGYGNDGEADYQHLRNIRTQLMDYGYETVYEFYQGSQGGADAPGEPTSSMINDAMNTGIGLFNYTGHGWLEGMSTGNYTISDVWNLENQGKYPFVISVACNNGTFVNATTLGEAFLRANTDGNPTGAIAFAGSSILMAWAEPMATQDEMTNIIVEYYENQRNATLGGLFYNGQIGMLTEYNSSYTAKEVMQTWILFGDPSVSYRNQITQNITADHAVSISAADISFDVYECNADGALATLSQSGVIIGKANILGGIATIELDESINFEEGQPNPVLTITKQNYKPYQTEIERSVMGVNDFDSSAVTIYPNPAKDIIYFNSSLKIQSASVYNMDGKIIMNNLKVHNQNADISSLPSGVYIFRVLLENGQIETFKLIKN